MKIVADSSCDSIENLKKNHNVNIERVPLHLTLGDKNFVDDESLDVTDYISQMSDCKTAAKTAAPSPDSYLERFGGSDSVFVVTLSKFLSSSYQNAVVAADMYKEQFGQKFIHVFDGLTAAVGNTIISLKIDEFIKSNLAEKEIVENVNDFISGMKTYFLLEKFDNLVKNGRMNPYIAKLASMLSVKPICGSAGGKIEMFGQARGIKRAIEKMADIIASDKSANHETKILGISHVQCLERAIQLRDEIYKRVKFKDVLITDTNGLCSTYADKKGLVVSY